MRGLKHRCLYDLGMGKTRYNLAVLYLKNQIQMKLVISSRFIICLGNSLFMMYMKNSYLQSECVNLSTFDILDCILLCCGNDLQIVGMFSSVLDLCSLVAIIILLLPAKTTKNIFIHSKCPLVVKTDPR